jgi:hypothetical protein
MDAVTNQTDAVLRTSKHALARWCQRFGPGNRRADLIAAANRADQASPALCARLHIPPGRTARVDTFIRAVFILAPCRERPGPAEGWIVVSIIPLEGE